MLYKYIKKISFTILSIIILLLLSCSKDDSITEINTYFSFFSLHGTTDKTYEIKGSSLRYIEPSTIFKIMGDNYNLSYEIEKENDYIKLSYKDNNIDNYMIFNSKTNIVTLSSYNFYSYDLIDRITYISKFSITKPTSSFEEVSINLSDYDIKIINEDGLILLPISIASLLISSPCNINFYFNPLYNDKTVFGFEGYPLPLVYSAINENFKGSISTLEERKNNLSYIELFIDQFYGLKEYKNMSSLDNVISSFETYKNDILSTSSDTYQFAEINYFNNLNDLHTSLIAYSPLSNYYDHDIIHSDSYNNLEEKLNNDISIRNSLTKKYPKIRINDVNAYIYDDSMLVCFNNFDTNKYNIINNLFILIEGNQYNIKNIIFDLTCNTGGEVFTAYQILSLLTDDSLSFTYQYNNSNLYYKYDAIFDNDQDLDFHDDEAHNEYNYYLLTSNSTFSAANLFSAEFKAHNIGKSIGVKSGGGTCVIGYQVLPDGTTFTTSSLKQIVIKDENGIYNQIENGIDVDYLYTNYTDLYDLITLDNYINNL